MRLGVKKQLGKRSTTTVGLGSLTAATAAAAAFRIKNVFVPVASKKIPPVPPEDKKKFRRVLKTTLMQDSQTNGNAGGKKGSALRAGILNLEFLFFFFITQCVVAGGCMYFLFD